LGGRPFSFTLALMIRIVIPLLVLSMISTSHAAMQFDEAHQKLAEAAIDESIANQETPGAVLLVGTKDGVIFEKAYGNRSLQPTTQPMKVDTIFDLASCSKAMGCATSIMVLSDMGKLKVTDPVCKYLPGMDKPDKAKITIEELLLHRGGFIPDNPMKDYENATHEQMLEKIYASKLKYEPGTDFAYSDLSFIVLGEVVKAASGGVPLSEFAKKQVFKPLGMKETTYLPPADWKDRIAPTEKRAGNWIVGDVHDPRAYALGGFAGHAGVFGTADDMARWCRMLLNGGELDGNRVLSEKAVAEMTTKRCLPDGKNCRGYGIDFGSSLSSAPRGERFEPGTTYGHTGYTGTMFWIDPKYGCFVILLTNRVHPKDRTSITPLRRKVSTIVGEALLGPAKTN
jgi:CubicO group peptidase (beta-lactamase class C family)